MLSTGKLADIDKAKRLADLTECLRTYDALQLWRDAEDVLRRDVLREFVKKVTLHMTDLRRSAKWFNLSAVL
jgi:hypothetical protein